MDAISQAPFPFPAGPKMFQFQVPLRMGYTPQARMTLHQIHFGEVLNHESLAEGDALLTVLGCDPDLKM